MSCRSARCASARNTPRRHPGARPRPTTGAGRGPVADRALPARRLLGGQRAGPVGQVHGGRDHRDPRRVAHGARRRLPLQGHQLAVVGGQAERSCALASATPCPTPTPCAAHVGVDVHAGHEPAPEPELAGDGVVVDLVVGGDGRVVGHGAVRAHGVGRPAAATAVRVGRRRRRAGRRGRAAALR